LDADYFKDEAVDLEKCSRAYVSGPVIVRPTPSKTNPTSTIDFAAKSCPGPENITRIEEANNRRDCGDGNVCGVCLECLDAQYNDCEDAGVPFPTDIVDGDAADGRCCAACDGIVTGRFTTTKENPDE
jgi:hypothetical protein